MGLFKGQIYNTEPANHIFVSNHPALLYAGMASFNINLLTQFIKENPLLQDNLIKGFNKFSVPIQNPFSFPNEENLINNILANLELVENNEYKFTYDTFNIKDVKIEKDQTITTAELISLIKWYEDDYLPDIEAGKDLDNYQTNITKINKIKNARQRFIQLSRDAKDTWGEKGLKTIYFRFYFVDKSKLKSSRIVVQKGTPTFVDIPRRATGPTYSNNQTKNENIGVYVDVNAASDPQDTVLAPLRCSYNPTLGTWEVQNQILARLLEDLEPAQIKAVDLSLDNVDDINSDSYYDPSNDSYLGQFATALAMPLSMENGNPHLFGPNLIKCGNSTKVEKIRVINRAPRTYTRGTLVMCHFMNGEWIVQDFGADVELPPPPLGVGRWQFAKFITSTRTHFREQDSQFNRQEVRPADWEEILRHQFYKNPPNNLLTEAILNAFPLEEVYSDPNFKLNTKIIQSSIFDQYKLAANDENSTFVTYTKTNPNGITEGDDWKNVAPLFWGPVFTEGLQRSNVSANAAAISKTSEYPIHTFNTLLTGSLNTLRSPHLPAEIASNGPWGEFSSPIESYHVIASQVNNKNYSFLTSGTHLNYRYYTEDNNDTELSLALQPVSNNKVTFIPLSAEFAAMDDLLAVDNIVATAYGAERNFRTKAINTITSTAATTDDGPKDIAVLGLGDALIRGNPEVGSKSTLDSQQTVYDLSADGANEALDNVLTVPYDAYVKTEVSTSQNVSHRAWIGSDSDSDKAAAELIGIITARNKIIRANGGSVNIEAYQSFGIQGTLTAFIQPPSLSILPFAVPVAFGGGGSFDVRPRSTVWGNTDFNIESFGVTALHVHAYDWWPENQTLFIAPYFTVLHFNPGYWGEPITSKTSYYRKNDDGEIDWTQEVANINNDDDAAQFDLLQATVQIAKYDVDIRQPTNYEGTTLSIGTTITSNSKLRPESFSNVYGGRRGALLTLGGFRYTYNVIGLKKASSTIDKPGSGFVPNNVYTTSKGVSITVTSVDDNGGITDFEFTENTDLVGDSAFGAYKLQGEGFLPSDFDGDGYTVSLNPGGGGESANIIFSEGIVYVKYGKDNGPKKYTPANGLRLTDRTDGTTWVRGQTKVTSITLDPNKDHKYPDQYEFFYFFHNDISHTLQDGTLTLPGYLQQVTITIS